VAVTLSIANLYASLPIAYLAVSVEGLGRGRAALAAGSHKIILGVTCSICINGPLGIIAVLGMMVFLPETSRSEPQKFGWFGFATLSLASGALQILLDRGEIKDWFGSSEIVIEALVAGSTFYLFLVHTFTAERPFMRPTLFRDRNFFAGVIFSLVASSRFMPRSRRSRLICRTS
jgi:hypothetical protein